jgi:hypothetical protein
LTPKPDLHNQQPLLFFWKWRLSCPKLCTSTLHFMVCLVKTADRQVLEAFLIGGFDCQLCDCVVFSCALVFMAHHVVCHFLSDLSLRKCVHECVSQMLGSSFLNLCFLNTNSTGKTCSFLSPTGISRGEVYPRFSRTKNSSFTLNPPP